MSTALPVSLAVVSLLSGAVTGQAAASKTVFLAGHERASGGSSQSTTYRVQCSTGAGAVIGRASSTSFVVDGGFGAGLEAPVTGRPWLTGLREIFATPVGSAMVSLYGTELDLGPSPVLTLGGQTTTAGSRERHRITTTLPPQPVPGWRTASLANPLGQSSLVDGIGILPMVFTEPSAVAPNMDLQLVFKGTQGDSVVFAIGLGQAAPTPMGGFRYGLALNPLIFFVFPILDPSGEFRLAIPSSPWMGPLFAQALFTSTNPGYAPGSFSNVYVFR